MLLIFSGILGCTQHVIRYTIFMLDLLTIGTVTIDLYYKGESITENDGRLELAVGGKYFADHFYEGLGGGGANVAIGVVKAGLKAGVIAKIGNNPFKRLILAGLDEAKVAHKDLCDLEEEYINISSILLNKTGEKTVINYRTPHQHIIEKESDFEKILKGKNLYMANLSKVALTERIDILRFAKKHNIQVFANLNVTDCRRPIEQIMHFARYVDVMIINGYEYADLIKKPYESIDFDENIVKKYAPFNEDDLLVITDGKKGSYAYYEGKVYRQPAVKTKDVVDTTGAGDGYTAGFIASYIQTQDVKSSMKAGAEYAVSIITKLGAN